MIESRAVVLRIGPIGEGSSGSELGGETDERGGCDDGERAGSERK